MKKQGFGRAAAPALAMVLALGLLLGGCGAANQPEEQPQASSLPAQAEASQPEAPPEPEPVRWAEELLATDALGNETIGYTVNDVAIEVTSIRDSLALIRAMVENGFTNEEIYDQTFPNYLGEAYEPMAQAIEKDAGDEYGGMLAHPLSFKDYDTEFGLIQTAYVYFKTESGMGMSALYSAYEPFGCLELVRQLLMRDGDSQEMYPEILRAIDYCEKTYQNREMPEAEAPLDYQGITYDLAHRTSRRTLYAELAMKRGMEGAAHVLAGYGLGQATLEEVQAAFDDPAQARDSYVTEEATSDAYGSLYDGEGNQVYGWDYGDDPDFLLLSITDKNGTKSTIDKEVKADGIVQMLTQTGGSLPLVSKVASYDVYDMLAIIENEKTKYKKSTDFNFENQGKSFIEPGA